MTDLHPPRRILLLVTTGGFTHAAPVLELGAVLASRGHTIHFATNTGQHVWAQAYPFIAAIHDVGPAVPDDATEDHYERMRVWLPSHGMGPMMRSKRLFDAAWPDTYRHLCALCADPATRPDFIVADFFADAAARDILRQFGIQIAVVWPQMPYFMAPASYVPGQPGFQVDVTLTSEHASLLSRFRNELVVFRALPDLVSWLRWTSKMRANAGVNYSLPPQTSPDYLVLVNSFFGLEVPKQLPPLIVPIGPILSDEYAPLDDSLSNFLSKHDRTIYVSLGTHVALPSDDLDKITRALIKSLDLNHINGVIWAIAAKLRTRFDTAKTYHRAANPPISMASILAGTESQFILPSFAPQRAVLTHPNTKLFLTHGGGSSANETLFHGVPVVVIPFFFDQLCNGTRLSEAGVGVSLDKSTFTADKISHAIGHVMADTDGTIIRNLTRVQRIAQIASRRKHHGVDLIEEVMYDQELRLQDGRELRPMHLQTADARMPLWKARNWDMWLVGLSGFAACSVACWWTLRHSLLRTPIVPQMYITTLMGFMLPRKPSLP
ncbi:hypothetical protein B0I35DRAFT_211656 [Stachybotrys elegans]|uniref:UDP-glycosyltransferases domain-containing protein n=1 Tax=Stachybotrys elegans TaxID=80388 RepID=A0A8K0WSC6_9HYPO|nr:hypothetical protein B0I35DRAFT_211656 [Stachybotrys elegans]